MTIDIEISDMKLKIVNIYGPNNDDPTFYSTLTEQFQSSEYDYLIWCGDFNMTLNPSLYSFNYITINNPQARRYVNNFISENNLIDMFRNYNPESKRYTWRKKTH